jgi:hypothetical protein
LAGCWDANGFEAGSEGGGAVEAGDVVGAPAYGFGVGEAVEVGGGGLGGGSFFRGGLEGEVGATVAGVGAAEAAE